MPWPASPNDQARPRCGTLLLVAVGLLLLALGGRLIHINVSLGDRLRLTAARQRQAASIIPARRGMIMDARGRVVAVTEHAPNVFVDPSRVDDVDDFASDLGPRINLSPAALAAKIRARADSRYVVVAKGVDGVTAESVRRWGHRAVGLEERDTRSYPLGESMAHVLGWVGQDRTGLEGIELEYDRHLRGTDGRRETIRDARRRPLRRSHLEAVAPVDGGHIVLTIDAEIQRMTEKALAEHVDRVAAESGVAVVVAPHSGDVLAMACWPTFDANYAADSAASLRRNRAVTDPTEPGSTFKPFLACGALEGGFVDRTEKINCHMGRHYFGRRLVTDTSPHGMMALKDIITYSSNIGMATIAERMGNEVLHDTIRRFGFGATTGLGYPGEAVGLVYPLSRWTSYSAASVAMGYEIALTPLQLANALAAIVNDGVLLRPRIVKRILGPDGTVIQAFDAPEIVRRVVPTRIARYVSRELLVSVVENGSGRRAQIERYGVLGKTGTAKLPFRDRRGYEPGAYLATFMGAAPSTRPEVVAVVMIRRPDPRLGYYGSVVSAPAVRDILAGTVANRGVPPDRNADQRVAAATP